MDEVDTVGRPSGATMSPELAAELEEKFKPTPLQVFQEGIRVALLGRGNHVYSGSVPGAEIRRRRARNKTARTSRKRNRQR